MSYLKMLEMCENTLPSRRHVSTQFLNFPNFTRVDIKKIFNRMRSRRIFCKYISRFLIDEELSVKLSYPPCIVAQFWS